MTPNTCCIIIFTCGSCKNKYVNMTNLKSLKICLQTAFRITCKHFYPNFTRKGFVSQPVQRKSEELFTTYALRSDQCLHPTAARCLTLYV